MVGWVMADHSEVQVTAEPEVEKHIEVEKVAVEVAEQQPKPIGTVLRLSLQRRRKYRRILWKFMQNNKQHKRLYRSKPMCQPLNQLPSRSKMPRE